MSLAFLIDTVTRLQERMDKPAAFRRLPDYESGTWTPSLTFGGAKVGMTTSVADGSWWSFGPLVVYRGRITLTAKGSSTGTSAIGGLPYTAATVTPAGFGVFDLANGMASISGAINCRVGGATKNVSPFYQGAANVAFLTQANFTDTSAIEFWGVYQASTSDNEVDWLEA